MSKPKLKLDFCDFNGVDKLNNPFTRLLSQRYEIEISDRPDLLIFQEGGHMNRLYTCKKLFWTGESVLPDWDRTDYAMTCHYLDDARHLRMPFYVWGSAAPAEDLVRRDDEDIAALMRSKTRFCSFLVTNSNRRRTGPRIDFFEKLTAHRQVDSGGPYRNNIGRVIPRGGEFKREFNAPCKFHLCWENKSLPGYTTEKLVDAMWARCIPIYWGSPRVAEEFNPKSFLDRSQFASDEAMIERILEIDADNAQWEAMLREPCFNDNTPNQYYSDSYALDFLQRVIDDPAPPVSRRRKFFRLGRWKLAKRQHFY
ncbi:hypothetical protein H5P28_15970 [Ruficoccus amylovorans]|uniref:Glycosyltransferase n=1 Tax=Ruficoccus amylovorans TaxID=1804625 RepID=A0A842HJF7_9BACT|nr:glycosyltransferase family 10 [Ruficoccus amylovorans]MBC2595764.1 hypothetical protein [Ruficoccus amylovorans]